MNVIYDNYYDTEKEEFLKQELFNEYSEERGWKKITDISTEDFYQYLEMIDQMNFDEMKEMVENFFNFQNSTFLLMGTITRWDGSYQGGFTFNNIDGIFRAIGGCEYFKIYDEKGHLYIDCSHHDGTNNFEIKKLTSKGEAYLENNRYQAPKKIHHKLWNNRNYTKLPRFYEFTFGKNFC